MYVCPEPALVTRRFLTGKKAGRSFLTCVLSSRRDALKVAPEEFVSATERLNV
jgi:hypothetical protein